MLKELKDTKDKRLMETRRTMSQQIECIKTDKEIIKRKFFS